MQILEGVGNDRKPKGAYLASFAVGTEFPLYSAMGE
jgi:hypothetical protein